MQTRKSFLRQIGMAALALAALPATASALDLTIHGYGHQGYLRSYHDESAEAPYDDGSWNFTGVALVFTATVTEDTRIWTQIAASNASDVTLDWAFVEHQLAEGVEVRAGQIKFPIALYNEVRRAKILHLASLEPFLYSEEAELMTEMYRGVGTRLNREVLGGELTLDAYFGESFEEEWGSGEEEAEPRRDMVGGRLRYDTPLEGLSVVVSAQTGKVTETEAEDGEEEDLEGRANVFIGSLKYENHGLEVSSEYGWTEEIERKSYAYYVEAGYELFDVLTPFVRYDYITTDKEQKSEPEFFQKDFVVGARYRVGDNVALKAEYHWMEGFALGGDEGPGDAVWQLFATSVNFAF